ISDGLETNRDPLLLLTSGIRQVECELEGTSAGGTLAREQVVPGARLMSPRFAEGVEKDGGPMTGPPLR
ncbi:MAG TPA: hypothetical protein VN648_26365, partial [Candidatus Methylomirabilis sp.]|nr:hypothetical protein [Candidatus Methylomirabilis sp.]